jgi:hypothetical protein
MAAISDWISASVLSGAIGDAVEGEEAAAAFSWLAVVVATLEEEEEEEDLDFEDFGFARIWTCFSEGVLS